MEILTRRFVLRDFAERDRIAFVAYHADPRYRALGGPEASDAGHVARLFETFTSWASEHPRRNYQLAISRRQDPHALLGCCGLRTHGCDPGSAELGIEFAPAYWGRHGYAVEVGQALLDFGFDQLGLREARGVAVRGNGRIERLARWFGAAAIATCPGPAWMTARGWSQTEWRLTREEWARGKARHAGPKVGRSGTWSDG